MGVWDVLNHKFFYSGASLALVVLFIFITGATDLASNLGMRQPSVVVSIAFH